MRRVGDDLQRVAVPAGGAGTAEVGLHARLVDEVLRRAAAQDHGGRPRPADDEVGRLDDVADHVDPPAARVGVAGLGQPHADRRIRYRRTEQRHPGAVRRGEDAVAARLVPEAAAEPVEVLAGGVRPRFEIARETGDPVVVVDELVLIDVGIVHTIDAHGLERAVVGPRRADEVLPAARLVQVVVQVGPRGDDAVDGAVVDQPGDGEPQAPGRQGPGDAQEDQHVVAQHPLPDPARRGEVAPLERDPLHPPQQLVGRGVRRDLEGLDRHAEEARLAGRGGRVGHQSASAFLSSPRSISASSGVRPSRSRAAIRSATSRWTDGASC